MRLDDPAAVRAEHASERGLATRKAAHRWGEGPEARDGAVLPPFEGPLRVRRTPTVLVAEWA